MSGSSPGRLAAAAQLASRQQQQAALASSYRPGLSADISGTAYDTISMSSYVSSMLGDAQQAQLGVNAAETASVSSATRHQINIMYVYPHCTGLSVEVSNSWRSRRK